MWRRWKRTCGRWTSSRRCARTTADGADGLAARPSRASGGRAGTGIADFLAALAAEAERMPASRIAINRAPVLALWAAAVAERLGLDEDAALTAGRAVAALNAQSKGRRLGLFKPAED